MSGELSLSFTFVARVLMRRIELLTRELQRQRHARIQAESLLEAKSEELYLTNAHLRRLYDHAGDAIFVHDQRGNIVDVNRIACQYLGYERERLLSMTVFDIESAPRGNLKSLWQHVSEDRPIQIDGQHKRHDGTTFPVEVRLAKIESVPQPLYLAIARDVSVRARHRKELETSRERLRQLASELTLTEAKERQRLAQILHDTIGHDLAVVRMHVKKIGDEAANENDHERIAMTNHLIEKIVRRVREVTFELSPATLYELGLPAAIKVVGRTVSEQHGIRCLVQSRGEWRSVPTDLSILLFYATRELIHNAVKHSQASQIDIRLDRPENSIIISVIDDGVGITPPNNRDEADSDGFGLFSIRERLAGLGGQFEIGSERHVGTRVTLQVPCQNCDEVKEQLQ